MELVLEKNFWNVKIGKLEFSQLEEWIELLIPTT